MNTSAIKVETIINNTPGKVWELWTTPAHIMKWNNAMDTWHTPSAENDLRVGGRFSSRMEARDGSAGFDFWGIYDEVVPGVRIAYTLGDGRKVEVDFSELDGRVRLVEVFEAEAVNPPEMQRAGWQAILDNFKRYAELKVTKLVSWNVNGLRACLEKGFMDFFTNIDADVFCLQETKLQEGQVSLELEGYHQYWNYAVKKGYSGTAVFTKVKPLKVDYDIGIQEHDQEGRVITLEYEDFYLVNVYTPNSQKGLERLPYRMTWEDAFSEYLKRLDEVKPVVVCGDLNVAHKEIDLKNPASNKKNAGFTPEEREKFTGFLEKGFIDTFRYLYPDRKDAYTWWSYLFNARATNAGWRIDYFCVSERLKEKIAEAGIHSEIMGSDHCPVSLVLNNRL